MHLEKKRTYACTFPVQRKEINVRFTMRYSSGKLSNDKVITTACNFWRQIACSFQVMSGNILFLGNKIFETPPIFSNPARGFWQKSSRMLITFFRPEFRSEDWNSVTKPSRPAALVRCSLRVNDLFQFCVFAVHTFVASRKAIRYSVNIALVYPCFLDGVVL